jgi:hypothetical protein
MTQTNVLEKKGYQLRISGWLGNLGNHIIQLSGAINVADHTQSRLTVPSHPLLKRAVYDFTDSRNQNCLEPISGLFFTQADCFQFPIRYDADRRRLFQKYILELVSSISLRERIDELLHPRPSERVEPGTLVINVRSGKDIFRTEPPPQSDYMQPPLSFYKTVIESHGYEDCLIVTEAARRNPCIAALLDWNPRIRIKTHTTVGADARTILSASHLVMCHSTFSWCLALMSKNLRVLHQPASFQVRGVKDFAVHTYAFDNYIKPGEWRAAPEQTALMLDHPIEDVSVVEEGLANGRNSEPIASHLW